MARTKSTPKKASDTPGSTGKPKATRASKKRKRDEKPTASSRPEGYKEGGRSPTKKAKAGKRQRGEVDALAVKFANDQSCEGPRDRVRR